MSGGLPARSRSSQPGTAPAAPAAPASGQITAGPSYPYPYDSFNVPVSDYTQDPYAVNGALFFVNNGVNYDCSGTSVASAQGTSDEDEVWTAGHCVSNTSLNSPGVFDSSAEFIPGYNGSVADYDPFGVFVASDFSVATNFLNNADISVDEGAMTVGTNAAGQTLGQAVGYDGFAWNFSSTENFTAFGYPVASPYTGEFMVEDIASTASSLTWPGGEGQPLIGIGDPMTGGSSGGAWDIDWSPSNAGYINGHNDYKLNAQPLAMYSPYQDSLSNTLLAPKHRTIGLLGRRNLRGIAAQQVMLAVPATVLMPDEVCASQHAKHAAALVEGNGRKRGDGAIIDVGSWVLADEPEHPGRGSRQVPV